MSTAQQQHGGAAPDALLPGPTGDGGGAPANGDRDSVDDVIERLLSVRGEGETTRHSDLFGALSTRGR